MKAKTPSEYVDVKPFVRVDKKHISNSYLSTLKRALTGEPQFFGSEMFLTFGVEHHKRALEPKEERTLLVDKDDLCTAMANSFRANPRIKQIMRGAQFEVEVNRVYRGAWVLLFLDIFKDPRGWDLKGTSCESEADFIKKSRQYDYFRQAVLYMEVCKIKEFSFIGQRKKPQECEKGHPGAYWLPDPVEYVGQPVSGRWVFHPLYFLNVLDYPVYLKEAREELYELIAIHLALRRYYEKRGN